MGGRHPFGPGAVAAYELASRLVGIVSGLFRSFLAPLAAHLALAQGEGGGVQFRSFKRDSARPVNSLVAFPALWRSHSAHFHCFRSGLATTHPRVSAFGFRACMGSILSLGAVPAYGALLGAGSGTRILLVQFFTAIACGVSGVVILSTGAQESPHGLPWPLAPVWPWVGLPRFGSTVGWSENMVPATPWAR